MTRIAGIAALLTAAALLRCTGGGDPVAGPSSEEGNPVLCGLVLDTVAVPAANAAITVYAVDSSASAGQPIPVAVTETDNAGRFLLFELAAGNYTIECASGDGGLSAFGRKSIVKSLASTPVDTFHLRAPGSIKGVVSRGGSLGIGSNEYLHDGFIAVRMCDIARSAVTDLQGRYKIDNVPEGVHAVAFRADDGFLTAVVDSVRVVAGSAAIVDTVILQRMPWAVPPVPSSLTGVFDPANALVTLCWRAVRVSDLLGYEVERVKSDWQTDTVFTTTDTCFIDTIAGLAAATQVYYVVRSVNQSFMRSGNAGPFAVLVR